MIIKMFLAYFGRRHSLKVTWGIFFLALAITSVFISFAVYFVLLGRWPGFMIMGV